jgi:hypothetical protein
MTPDWLFQVMWFGAGVGGTGAIWYFLSERNSHAALWTGFATAVVFLLAITLHIRNDLLRKERQPATSTPGPASQRPALENLPAAVTPSAPQRQEELKTDSQERSPAENETPIMPYPPASTPQDMTAEQILPDPAPERPTIREKSAAEILVNLEGIKLPYQFHGKVKELYLGRWTREPGWQAKVHDLPGKLSAGYWHCSFKEVGSDTIILASTLQDISMLRRGDSVTISGKISSVGPLEIIGLEDATIRGDKVPFP